MTRLGLNQVVDRWKTRRWREDLDSKTTLRIYRNKADIGEEGIYRNDFMSVLIFHRRSNTLGLRWRNRFSGGAVDLLAVWSNGGYSGPFRGGVR